MGNDNVIVNRWLSQKERFADLMNGCLFQGRQVVLPDQLEKIDRGSELLVTGKEGAEKGVQRYRDVAMRWKDEAELTVLAAENQGRVHYATPARTMIYDGLTYAEQMEERWEKRGKDGNPLTRGEFLSHFQKTDRLCPVITLVFYYGSHPWDGSRDLHEMIFGKDMGRREEYLRKYIPNYRINLVDAERIPNIEMFQTDLQYVLGMIKCRGEKRKILDYVDANRSYFQQMNRDSYQALGVFLNSDKWLKGIELSEKKGEADVCKALEEIYEDGKMEGIAEGIEKGKAEGKAEGREEKLKELIMKKVQKGKSLEVIAEELEESVENIRRLI